MLTSASARCSLRIVPSGSGMPWSNIIMSCWIMPSHFGSGYLPRAGRVLLALQRLALLDVGARGLRSGFLVVPQREADRALGLHVGRAEDARQLHHQRGARAVVVGRLAPAVAVHVAADDVHLFGMRGADLGAEHHLARPRRGRLHVQRAQLFVRLLHRIGVDAGRNPVAARPAAADREAGVGAAASAAGRRRRIVDVLDRARSGSRSS